MRIGIDARMFQEGLGIGRYIEKLLTHLETMETRHEYVIFLRKKNFNAYHPKNLRFKKVCANYPWYSFSEQIFFPILLMRYRIDCMHFPHFNVPIVYPRKYIVTIHDCIMLTFPLSASSAATSRHPFIHMLKYRIYQCVLACAAYRAAHIITVSEYVKKDIMEKIGVDGRHISVIYEAADFPCAYLHTIPLPTSVQKPYILYTGNAYPHKNLEGLLQAFRIMESRAGEDIRLVLCGQEDFFFKKTCARIQELRLAERVKHLGFVSDVMLSELYHHAVACIIPSFEEGFGLPALEAMACGTPVIASNSTCFGEILGDAALFIDPYSPKDIARGVCAIAHDETLRERLRERGYACVSRYSWERTALQTRMLYEKNS